MLDSAAKLGLSSAGLDATSVNKRLRRVADSSVKRYDEAKRVAAELAKMPVATREHGARMARLLSRISLQPSTTLSGQSLAKAPITAEANRFGMMVQIGLRRPLLETPRVWSGLLARLTSRAEPLQHCGKQCWD